MTEGPTHSPHILAEGQAKLSKRSEAERLAAKYVLTELRTLPTKDYTPSSHSLTTNLQLKI